MVAEREKLCRKSGKCLDYGRRIRIKSLAESHFLKMCVQVINTKISVT